MKIRILIQQIDENDQPYRMSENEWVFAEGEYKGKEQLIETCTRLADLMEKSVKQFGAQFNSLVDEMADKGNA